MFDFDAGIKKVGDLLARPYVIQVPAYQRSYVWTSKEAGTLLENILETMEDRSKGSYFLSYMLFLDPNPSRARSRLPNWVRAPAPHVLQVIDGFQRLTTLTILLCVLRDLDAGKGEPADERIREAIGSGGAGPHPRLSLHEGDDEFFEAHVRAPGATQRAALAEQVPQLVQLDLDRAQPLGVLGDDVGAPRLRGVSLFPAQPALLLFERVDAGLDRVVVHGAS